MCIFVVYLVDYVRTFPVNIRINQRFIGHIQCGIHIWLTKRCYTT